MIHRFLPPPLAAQFEPPELPGEFRLVGDLGLDSLSVLEFVFVLEELFQVEVSDEALRRIQNVDEAIRAVRTAVAGRTSTKFSRLIPVADADP